MPGLADSLDLDKDFSDKITSDFTIKADAKDFTMENSYTYGSASLLNDIDLDDVDLTVNKKKVTVTLPEVKVLECKVDEASLDGDSYHAKTTGLGAKKPDAAMETEAFSEAVKHITNMAEEDEATKKIVERRVKKLLSQYIENMGKIQKIQYDIEWKTKEKDTQN